MKALPTNAPTNVAALDARDPLAGTERLAAALRQGDFALSEHAGFVTVPLDVLDKLHDHYCGPERSDPVADPLWAELGRYIDSRGRKP